MQEEGGVRDQRIRRARLAQCEAAVPLQPRAATGIAVDPGNHRQLLRARPQLDGFEHVFRPELAAAGIDDQAVGAGQGRQRVGRALDDARLDIGFEARQQLAARLAVGHHHQQLSRGAVDVAVQLRQRFGHHVERLQRLREETDGAGLQRTVA